MTNLVPTNEPSLPTPPPPGIERAVSYLTNKLVAAGPGNELPASEAPTEAQRRGLERRLAALDAWLAPYDRGDEQRVRDELYALLSTRKGDTAVGDARAIVAIYLADLRDLPFHAIQAACLDFRHGRVQGDKGFRPLQADIRRQAQTHLGRLAVEQRRIRAILAAELVDRRPDAETRRASAEAARAAFKIPSGGLRSREPHREPLDTPDAIGALARGIKDRSNAAFERFRDEQCAAEAGEPPPGRFEGETAA